MIKKTTIISLVTVLLSLLSLNKLTGQVSLTNASASASINFSNATPASVGSTPSTAFTGAGFSSNPTNAGRLNSNAWAVTGFSDGDMAFGGTSTAGDLARGSIAAAVTSGGLYAYTGAPGSAANPALMVQPAGSDFLGGTVTVRIVNNGTTAINSFTVSYDLFARNDQGRSSSFNFSYSLDHSAYTAVPALDYTSTAALDALGWVKVGTSPSRSTVINSLNIAPGGFFYIRWTSNDVGGSGSRDELGLDDIAISAAFQVVSSPSFNITNNGLQPTATSVFQGSNKNMLQRFVLRETNVAAGTLNTVSIPLAGTYTASDISAAGLKLYTAATNNFASATVVSSQVSAAAGSGETVTFNSLNYAVAQNSTQYFWVTSDIAVAATAGNTIRATALNAGNFSFAAGTVTATVNQGGIQTIAALVPSLNITNNGTQPAAATVFQSSNNNLLQSFVVTEGNVAAGTLNDLSIPLAGTYVAADINASGLKLYGGTTNSFSSATLLSSKASTSLGSGETVNFNALNYAIAKNSVHYFWVTADIDASANVGNDINAASLSAGNFTFAAGTVTASVNAGGTQTILEPDPVLNIVDNGTQPAAASILQNSNDNLLQSFVITENNVGPAALSSIAIPLVGTYMAADINGVGLKLYSSTTNNFASATVLASQTSASSGSGETATFAFNLGIAKNSTHYFWVTADIATSATVGNTIHADALNVGSFSFAAGTVTVSVNAGGVQTIAAAAITTSLQPAYCGIMATAYTQVLYAYYVGAASQYEYKLENAAASYTQTYVKTNNNFNLAQFTGLTNGTTYSVSIRLNVNNTWGNYGPVCNVTTPSSVPTTSLQPSSCGITATAYNQVLYAEYVGAATQYEYKLENVALGYTQTYVKTNNNFNLGQFTGLTNGTTYSVSVRANVNNTWGSFGPVCQVTTPSVIIGTSLQPAYCGITATAYTQVLYANNVTGATQYEYKLENAAASYTQTYVKTNSNFNLAQFTGLANSTTYSVSIRVNVNNTWGNYGAVCNVTTPSSVPTTSLQPAYCGITATAYNQVLYANAVAGATQYEYKLENTALGYSQTYVKTNNNFNLTQFTGLTNSTTYSVSLRVRISGIWGAYGPACTVNTPSSARMASREGIDNGGNSFAENSFDAMAYPNPFSNEFSLNLLSYTVNETVTIRAFDATGKLMEEQRVSPESIKDLNIGSAYAQGLYNIVISQGAQTKSIKVIKQ